MKISFFFFSLLMGLITAFSANALVLKSHDKNNHCTLYRAFNSHNSNGEINDNEKVMLDLEIYGFTFKNLEIDFKKQEALVEGEISVVIFPDRPLISHKLKISGKNIFFQDLINQTNRPLSLFETVCITKNNYILYANKFDYK